MDFDEYKRKFYVQPAPPQKFKLSGLRGAAIYASPYEQALAFYTQVFGPPHYVEGETTHGWRLGDSWLSLFPSESGNPLNAELALHLDSADELDKLFAAFVEAGAEGDAPAETLMYVPVYAAFLQDPFGLAWTLVHELPTQ